MFESHAGVYAVRLDNPQLPAAGVVALLDASSVGPELARRLAAVDLASLDHTSELTVVRLWDRVLAWASAQQQRAIARVAESASGDGHEWIADEVAAALHLAPATAAKRVRAARELTGRLADTFAELAAGRISYWHAAHLAQALERHSDAIAAAVQDAVLPRARRQTCGQFRRSVAEAIAAADPATLEERHALAAAHTSDVEVWREPDGMAALVARGPATQIFEIFDRVAWQAAADVGADDSRTAGARRIDALVQCMNAAGTADGPPGARRHVGVLLDLPTALGLADHPGEIPGYGPIPASVARDFAKDAAWQAWITDAATGRLAGMGTEAYRPTARLREFVEARDRTCRHPGCMRPAWRCDVDHATPHAAGGCTDAANCGCFCRRHHRLKHESAWRIRRERDGTVHFTSPLGMRHTTEPPDYLWMLDPPKPDRPRPRGPTPDGRQPDGRQPEEPEVDGPD